VLGYRLQEIVAVFCPTCQSEYRPGFTRCPTCDVDLVADLGGSGEPGTEKPPTPTEVPLVTMSDYCGFVTLDDAREARTRLWAYGIPCEISVRLKPNAAAAAAEHEEYWLRVPRSERRGVVEILGYDLVDSEHEQLSCSVCGKPVGTDETFCPHCGARFE
jgi:hypothetical protein